MRRVIAQIAAASVLSAALVLAAQQFFFSGARESVGDEERIASIEARLDAFEARLGGFEDGLAQLRESASRPVEVRSRSESSQRRESAQEFEARLRKVEALLAELAPREAPNPARPRAARVARRLPVQARDAERVILDPRASAEEKVAAHQGLRRQADAYTPQMLQALIRIGQTHANAELRASVWTFFDGSSRSEMLVAPLLHAMRHDASDEVRAEAAETLGNYMGNAAVRQALTWHATHDASRAVREKARRSVPVESGPARGTGR